MLAIYKDRKTSHCDLSFDLGKTHAHLSSKGKYTTESELLFMCRDAKKSAGAEGDRSASEISTKFSEFYNW